MIQLRQICSWPRPGVSIAVGPSAAGAAVLSPRIGRQTARRPDARREIMPQPSKVGHFRENQSDGAGGLANGLFARIFETCYYLPRGSTGETMSPPKPRSPPPAEPSLSRLLYVDDDPTLTVLTRISLERVGGFMVKTCASGAEALAPATDFAPDL